MRLRVCLRRRKGAESPRPVHASMFRLAAVRTLRSLSLAAMALWRVIPLRTISSMMGRTLAVNRLAMSGLPRCFPRGAWRPPERLWYALKFALARARIEFAMNIAPPAVYRLLGLLFGIALAIGLAIWLIR